MSSVSHLDTDPQDTNYKTRRKQKVSESRSHNDTQDDSTSETIQELKIERLWLETRRDALRVGRYEPVFRPIPRKVSDTGTDSPEVHVSTDGHKSSVGTSNLRLDPDSYTEELLNRNPVAVESHRSEFVLRIKSETASNSSVSRAFSPYQKRSLVIELTNRFVPFLTSFASTLPSVSHESSSTSASTHDKLIGEQDADAVSSHAHNDKTLDTGRAGSKVSTCLDQSHLTLMAGSLSLRTNHGIRTHVGENSSSTRTSNSYQSKTTNKKRDRGLRRSRSQSSESDSEPSPSPKKRSTDNTAEDCPDRLLACPYWKYDPTRYSESNNRDKNYRGCASCYLKDIGRLKQHLYRVHKMPDNHCQRCYEVFQSASALSIHTKAIPACTPQECLYAEKFSEPQLRELKKRWPKKGLVESWYHIWHILFPRTPPPDSPFAGENINPTINRRDAPRLVDEFRERAPGILQEILTHQLASTVTPSVITSWLQSEEAQNIMFRSCEELFSRFGRVNSTTDPPSSPPDAESWTQEGSSFESADTVTNHSLSSPMIDESSGFQFDILDDFVPSTPDWNTFLQDEFWDMQQQQQPLSTVFLTSQNRQRSHQNAIDSNLFDQSAKHSRRQIDTAAEEENAETWVLI